MSTTSEDHALVATNAAFLPNGGGSREVLERLYRVAIAMQISWGREERLAAFARGAQEVVGFDRVSVLLATPDGTGLELVRSHGERAAIPPAILPLSRAAGPLYQAFQTRRPVSVLRDEDLETVVPLDSSYRSHPSFRSTRFVIVPLVVGGRTIGVVGGDNKPSRRPIPRASVEPFTLLGQLLATALEETRLHSETRARAQETTLLCAGLTLLNQASRALHHTLDVGGMLNGALEDLARTFGAGAVFVDLLAEAGGVERRAGYWLSEAHGRELAPQGGDVSRLAQLTRTPFVLRDITERPDIVPLAHFAHGVKSLAAFPVFGRDQRVLAVLVLCFQIPQSFPDSEIHLLAAYADQLGMALENAQLYEETERRRREAEVLAELAQTVNASLDLGTVLQRVLEGVKELCRSDRARVALLEPSSGALVIRHWLGTHFPWYRTLRIEPGKGVGGQVLKTGRPFRTAHYAEDPRISKDYLALVRESGVVAEMAVPIRINGRVDGVLYVDNHSSRPFTDRDEALLVQVADHAAIAINNARLYEASNRRRRAAETLADVGRLVSESLDPEEVVQRIADSVCVLFGAKSSALYRMGPKSGDLVGLAFSGDAGPGVGRTLIFPRGTGLVGLAVRERGPAVTADFLADSRIVLTPDLQRRMEQTQFRAGLAAPLLVKDRVIGALSVEDRAGRVFDDEEIRLLQAFATQATVALENARLYTDLLAALQEIDATQERVIQGERIRALGEMAGGVAHDFNNALAVVLGRTQLLQARITDPEHRRQLEVIEKAARDGSRTVKRIQEFTRKRRSRPFQPVDLNEVVREVVELTRTRWKDEAQAKGIPYDVAVDTVPLPPVAGDPSELREALTNLVLNALDAMPEGGRLALKTEVEGERVSCVVTDTGIGMPEAVRRRVFDPFFTTKGEKGNGLGLSMVYGIVTRHGGEINVQSQVGRGSTFTIRLPMGGEIPESAAVTPPAEPPRSARILVIDDELEVREALREMLAEQGHAVVGCGEAGSGLAHLQEEEFDLVITDLAMPGLTGWQVASSAKLRNPEMPVVLVTGWGDQIESANARAKGVDFILSKPFSFEEVQSAVAGALNRAAGGRV